MEGENGLIYGLTNPYFTGLVKIGMTRRLDINRRIRELGTAVPVPFSCAFAYVVPLNRLSEIESALHDNYEDKRVGSSEFFKIDPAKVENLLRRLGSFESMAVEVQTSIDLDEAKRSRRKNMDFFELGLRVGDTLAYARDNNIRCVVVDKKAVDFGSQRHVSLSKVTSALLGYPAQPSQFWITESGDSLRDLQDRAYARCIERTASAALENSGRIAAAAESLKNKCEKLAESL